MDSERTVQAQIIRGGDLSFAGKRNLLLRMIRAAQPITRTDIVDRLKIDKSTISENIKPLIQSGVIREDSIDGDGRRHRVLSFADGSDYFIGLNLGVRRSQIGTTTLSGEISDEEDFETPKDPASALVVARQHIEKIRKNREGTLRLIGVSVPGMTDVSRQALVFAPNLNWRDVAVADKLRVDDSVAIVVENDATAAATFEARNKLRESQDGWASNFILVRSGTGIGVGMVIGGEVFRGTGQGRGLAGEFGHMTIVAGGKQCVCGNRGCWERYASAASAASLYTGDRPLRPGETLPRFVEIVAKAENGEVRARRTLEKIGEYLGIGIANVIMGSGVPRVMISGRLVYAWQFIEAPLREAISRSVVGGIEGWSVEPGSPAGAAIGGALEVAVDEFLQAI